MTSTTLMYSTSLINGNIKLTPWSGSTVSQQDIVISQGSITYRQVLLWLQSQAQIFGEQVEGLYYRSRVYGFRN